jgi:putative transposase
MLAEAGPDILAFTSFPQPHWRQIWSNNPRSDCTRRPAVAPTSSASFADRPSVIRLVGMLLAEQHDEWAVARRYMSPASLAKARLEVIDAEAVEDVRASSSQRADGQNDAVELQLA